MHGRPGCSEYRREHRRDRFRSFPRQRESTSVWVPAFAGTSGEERPIQPHGNLVPCGMSSLSPKTQIHDLSATDLVSLYRRRELSPVEAMRDVLARIERFNPLVNAFLLVDADGALAAAREAETRWARDEPMGLVDGVPATVKDNIWAKGWPTRKGSATTDLSPAPSDSPALARLREHGAIILGKTTMPEHGWIGVCHSPLTGITRNPWKLDRTPGGSTGGGAVAALLNLGALHLGTDGAGSLRIPAAFTG